MSDKQPFSYSKELEEEILNFISDKASYLKEELKFEEEKIIVYPRIATLSSNLLSKFRSDWCSPLFIQDANPIAPPQTVETGKNVLFLGVAPFASKFYENEQGERKFSKDRPSIPFTEPDEAKLRYMVPKEVLADTWFYSFFRTPINKMVKPEKEFKFFSYLFYLLLNLKKPSFIFVTNQDLFNALTNQATWTQECKVSIEEDPDSGKERFKRKLLKILPEEDHQTEAVPHIIKLAKIDHPFVMKDNPDKEKSSMEIIKKVIGIKEKKDLVVENVFQFMSQNQKKIQDEKKKKEALKKKRGSELHKKEQLKIDARQKKQEEKTKKSINFQREHRPLYSEGHIPIGKREAVVEKSLEKKKKILIELE